MTANVARDGADYVIFRVGKWPDRSFNDGFVREFGIPVRIADYQEHAIGNGTNALAISFVEAQVSDAQPVFGVGMHNSSLVSASLNAIISAVNSYVYAAASGGNGHG